MPQSFSAIGIDFLLVDTQLCVRLGDLSFAFADVSITGEVSFQVLDVLLKHYIALIVDVMGYVEVGRVGTTLTKTILSSVDGGRVEKRAEVFELASAQLKLEVPGLSSPRSMAELVANC